MFSGSSAVFGDDLKYSIYTVDKGDFKTACKLLLSLAEQEDS
jgi:hypothetical protein